MTLYFLWGDEDYLIEKEIALLKEKILGGNFDAINFKIFDNPKPSELIEILSATSLMFGAKLYVIKADKYFLETKSKYKLEDSQTLALIDALKNLNSSLNVILLCPVERTEAKKPDSRKKLYKETEKIATIKHFEALKPWETYKAEPWVREQLKRFEIKMGSDVLSYFVQNVGVSYRELENELEKIKLALYPANIVTKDTIDKTCVQNSDSFSFFDAFLSKNKEAALELLSDILEKQHYLPLLAFMQNNLRKNILIKMYSKSMSSFEIAKKVGMKDFAVKKALEKLSSISLESLVNLRQSLTITEFKIKKGELDAVLALEAEIAKVV